MCMLWNAYLEHKQHQCCVVPKDPMMDAFTHYGLQLCKYQRKKFFTLFPRAMMHPTEQLACLEALLSFCSYLSCFDSWFISFNCGKGMTTARLASLQGIQTGLAGVGKRNVSNNRLNEFVHIRNFEITF